MKNKKLFCSILLNAYSLTVVAMQQHNLQMKKFEKIAALSTSFGSFGETPNLGTFTNLNLKKVSENLKLFNSTFTSAKGKKGKTVKEALTLCSDLIPKMLKDALSVQKSEALKHANQTLTKQSLLMAALCMSYFGVRIWTAFNYQKLPSTSTKQYPTQGFYKSDFIAAGGIIVGYYNLYKAFYKIETLNLDLDHVIKTLQNYQKTNK